MLQGVSLTTLSSTNNLHDNVVNIVGKLADTKIGGIMKSEEGYPNLQ